jgi:amino acid transporter
VNFRGISESVKINVVLTLIEFGGLILIIVIGVGALLDGVGDVGNAFSTSEAKEAGNDVSLIPAALAGTALAFYALIGFEDSVNVAEEAKDPIRDYPRALFGGLLIAGTLYIVIGIIAPAVLSYATLTDEDTTPLLEIATTGPLAVEVKIFAAIGVLALINGALINMIMASRLTYGMARQRIVPQFFGKVHRGRQTPWAAILFTTGLAVILTATGDISDLAATTTTLLLIVFITVNISVLVLRRDPVSHQHFVAPTLLPAIGAVAALALLIHRVANDTEQITRALLLLGLGLVFWLANWVATRGNDEFDTGVITAIEHPERDEPPRS